MVTTPRMAAVLTVVVAFALQRVVCLEQDHNGMRAVEKKSKSMHG
jgi:hypothetical protein